MTTRFKARIASNYLSCLGLTFCLLGGACSKSDDGRAPREEVPVDTGDLEDEEPSTVGALNIASMTFTEIDLELVGDLRVKKVERDAKGDYYVALISDVKATDAAEPTPGYALFKFSAEGKELWRFPTLQNSMGSSSQPLGRAYQQGILADMNVTPAGDVWLIGTQERDVALNPLGKYSNAGRRQDTAFSPWVPSEMPGISLGHLTFLSRVSGSGVTADAPKVVSHAVLATPLWWTPQSIRAEADGTIMIESASNGNDGDDGVVQQVQKISADFTKLVASACYGSPGINTSSGELRLVNVAYAATRNLVERMTGPIAAVGMPALPPEKIKQTTKQVIMSKDNRCWDMIGTRVMPIDDPEFVIVRPSMLIDGETLQSKAESLIDLLAGTNGFEEYDVSNRGISGSTYWAPSLWTPAQSPWIDEGLIRWHAMGDQIFHFGLDAPDILRKSQLVIGNGRTVEAKAWKVELGSNSQRRPASLDLFLPKGFGLVAAWTDLHLAGETNEGSRSLRLAHIASPNVKTAKADLFEFEAPPTTENTSFSSVRVADAAPGKIAVFATITNPATSVGSSTLVRSTLLIGFSQ